MHSRSFWIYSRHQPFDLGAGWAFGKLSIKTDVFAGHAFGREAFLHVATYRTGIDLQIAGAARQFRGGGPNVTANAFLHDLVHGAAAASQDRGATRHGFNHHQPEWLVPLHGKKHGHGVRQELILFFQANLADIFNELSVHVGFDLALPIIFEERLDFTGDLQGNARFVGDLNRHVRALRGRDSSQKAQVLLLTFLQAIERGIDSVMDCPRAWVAHLATLKVADADIRDFRKPAVKIFQSAVEGVVHSIDDGSVRESDKAQAGSAIQVNDVRLGCSILDRPR